MIVAKIPKYACSACEFCSTRKWNIIRHISMKHTRYGVSNTYYMPWMDKIAEKIVSRLSDKNMGPAVEEYYRLVKASLAKDA